MKIEYRRLNHITIAVPAGEHDTVRAFYGGVLGLKEVERPDALNKVYDLIWYEWTDILLHLEFTPPWTRPTQNRHVGVEVKQIQPVRAYLEQQPDMASRQRTLPVLAASFSSNSDKRRALPLRLRCRA
jgi:catechol 2,3-dioxygenase-like lactoylglutathione lyase family enzyme